MARWTAKQALARVLSTPLTLAGLRRIEVRHAASGAPVACLDGEPVDLQISLTDRAGWAVCLVGAGSGRLGCDLELVEPRSDAFVRDYLTAAERRYVDAAPGGHGQKPRREPRVVGQGERAEGAHDGPAP